MSLFFFFSPCSVSSRIPLISFTAGLGKGILFSDWQEVFPQPAADLLMHLLSAPPGHRSLPWAGACLGPRTSRSAPGVSEDMPSATWALANSAAPRWEQLGLEHGVQVQRERGRERD